MPTAPSLFVTLRPADPQSKRTYLGRVDPESNLIIGKGTREHHNTTRLGASAQPERVVIPPEAASLLEEQRNQIAQLQKQILELEEKLGNLQQVLVNVHKLTRQVVR